MKCLLYAAIPLLLAAGCTTTQIVSSGEMAAVAPRLSVERFLQASNERDLHAMAGLFGTADGPVIETGGAFGCMFKRIGSWIGLGDRCTTLQEVELRMDAIAQILQHEDYTIVTDERVPGRQDQTTRVGVNMRIRGRDISDVPFLVVQTDQGRWLIEEIVLRRITGG
ncbi:MAG: hypothetical protein HKO65_02970 [Gemmatimonadetes bacterium]|nr:hypothetical protein [Gemmatimonadota bacterium]NNM04040.1 hypothetical protein [Gemmatimonadota bacterium]